MCPTLNFWKTPIRNHAWVVTYLGRNSIHSIHSILMLLPLYHLFPTRYEGRSQGPMMRVPPRKWSLLLASSRGQSGFRSIVQKWNLQLSF